MKQFIRIGVDLAKNYFQVHALANEGGPAVTRKLKRSKMHEFFAQIEPCLIGMEACGSAHYWARELETMGHEVLLMPPAYTDVYKRQALDAFAHVESYRKRLRDGPASHGAHEGRALAGHGPPHGLQAGDGGVEKLATTARTKSVAESRQRCNIPRRNRSRVREEIRRLIHAVTENPT